ncbi:MAG: hypothetical protein U9P70_00815 [Patescibacteria group bacterium]|nr:hypothetical protein [Patescibacteria group bacterium]
MHKATIAKSLREVGKALEDNGSNSGPVLRRLQSELNAGQRSNLKSDFICYFLSTFIDDVFYNLSGDFPYNKKHHEIISNIFKGIGKALSLLAESITDDKLDCSPAYESMVNSYLDGLDRIRACCDRKEQKKS